MMPKLHITLERWKFSQQYNCYVSTQGRIKGPDKKIATPGVRDGYLYYRGKPVHRIVLETFKPTPGYAYLTVDHIDRNTRNASLSNLVWMDKSENAAKAGEENKANNPPPEPPKDEDIFLINKMPMTKMAALKIMKADTTLDCNANYERAFTKALNAKTGDPVKFGKYTIQYVAAK